jgi:hypothetical protein
MLAGDLPTKIQSKAPIAYESLAQEWNDLLRKSLKLDSVQSTSSVSAVAEHV